MEKKSESIDYSSVQTNFAHNFKNFLSHLNITQKELAAQMGVLESTVSNCNKRLPTWEFLIKLKNVYPEISFDQLLLGDINEEKKEESGHINALLYEKLSKFTGIYYAYYLDTSKKKLIKEKQSIENMLKVGLIYVFDDIKSTPINKAICLAVYGLKGRDEAEYIRNKTEELKNVEEIAAYLREKWGRYFYKGYFDLSQSHIYIQVEQDRDNKDSALIILHHTESNNEKYIGGLGTINSASSGRPSDPVVQVVAISRQKVNLTDEEIFKNLLFFRPTINFDEESEEILNLSKRLYERKAQLEKEENDTMDKEVFEKYIPDIIKSNMERLLKKNIERNTLWFGKISGEADQEWYEILNQHKNCLGSQGTDDGKNS